MSSRSLSLMIMDPPYESSNTMTAFRVIESALKKGRTVERSGEARKLRTVVLAAPTIAGLKTLIRETELLEAPTR